APPPFDPRPFRASRFIEYQQSWILAYFMGANRFVRAGVGRSAMPGHRASTARTPLGTRRAGPPHPWGRALFGRRRRRSPLEVDGTTAQLAPVRRAKIAAVKWANI
ncbi:MAG: hypothetical protein V3R30_06400, partial [Kiloniellales bacterium]